VMRLPTAWSYSTGSASLTIGIVDTVLDIGHPEFAGRILAAGDCFGVAAAGGSACPTYTQTDVSRYLSESSDHGHGTHVGGIAAAAGNNSRGVAGVAWQVKIASANVFGLFKPVPADPTTWYTAATDGDVAKAIDWLLTQSGIRVINLSLGGPENSTTINQAIDRAYAAGVLVVAAAGNCGSSSYSANGCASQNEALYPAAYALQTTPQHVLPVAATTSTDAHASFSNQNDYVQLRGVSAPGQSVISTYPRNNPSQDQIDDGYATLSGTSMAAPHVTGLAALMWSLNPNLTVDGVIARLRAAVVDLGMLGADVEFGSGRIDAYSAVRLAQTASPAFIGRLPLRRAATAPADAFRVDTFLRIYPNGSTEGLRSAVQSLVASTDDVGAFAATFSVPSATYDVVIDPPVGYGLSREFNSTALTPVADVVLQPSAWSEGDVDGNNRVDTTDMSLLKSSFRKSTGQTGYDSRADFNRDGRVTLLDFSLLSRGYGKAGPVQEP